MGRLIILLLFLSFSLNTYGEWNIKGSKITYLNNGLTITESEVAPDNPEIGSLWKDINNNITYIWDGDSWECKRTTQEVKNLIDEFKSELIQVSDIHAKKALKALGKIVGKLYKEVIE